MPSDRHVVEPSPSTSEPRSSTPSPRAMLRALRWWLLPTLAISLLALWQATWARDLVESIGIFDVFYFQFATEEVQGARIQVAILLIGYLATRWLPAGAGERILRWFAARVWWLAGALVVVLALGAHWVYLDTPLSMDEYAMAYQAEVFAAGRLAGEVPSGLAQLFIPHVYLGWFFEVGADGRVISLYWPGFSLLLTPFVALGVPWLLNPLLTGGVLLLLVHLARRLLSGERQVGWVVLLALASPQLMIHGLTYYAMTAHLFFNLAFASLLLRPTATRLVAAGLCGSIALVLHNPVPHALFAIPWLIWMALGAQRLRRLAWLALGYLPIVLLVGVGWLWVRFDLQPSAAGPSPSATVSSEVPETAPPSGPIARSAGFVRSSIAATFAWPERSLLKVRLLEWLRYWLWTAPGLVLLAGLGSWQLCWRRRRAPDGSARSRGMSPPGLELMVASTALTALVYFFYRVSQAQGWGFRYLHQVWAGFALAAAFWLGSKTADRWSATSRAVVLTLLLAVPVSNAVRALQVRGYVQRQTGQVGDVEWNGEGVILVFVDPGKGLLRSDFIRNDPFLRDRVWHLVSCGAECDEEVVRGLFADPELIGRDGIDSLWHVSGPRNR